MEVDEVFHMNRTTLFGVAYRMVGSVTDAEDIVQDVFERWLTVDHASIERPAAYLTTMATRRALDHLGSARVNREHYPGPWLAEPIRTEDDPAAIVELGEAATLGFLHLLDVLTPAERAVHLLHQFFDFSYSEIGVMIEKTESNCRQIAKRARTRIEASKHQTWHPPEPAEEARVVGQFLHAILNADTEAAAAMLADDVVGLSDGGPNRHAARQPVVGPERLARFYVNLGSRLPQRDKETVTDVTMLRVNNQPGLYITVNGEPLSLTVFQVRESQIERIFTVVNPDKLESFNREFFL